MILKDAKSTQRNLAEVCSLLAVLSFGWTMLQWLHPALAEAFVESKFHPLIVSAGAMHVVQGIGLATHLPAACFAAYALWQLRNYLVARAGSDQFSHAQAVALRRSGTAFLIAGPLLLFGRGGAFFLIARQLHTPPGRFLPTFLVGMLLLCAFGLALLGFSKQVLRGVELENDVQGFV